MGRNKRVAVLQGGRSTEREVSLRSGAAVSAALTRLGYDVVVIDAVAGFVPKLLAESPDVVFIALHGRYGEDGTVQGLLECLGLPYTNSGVFASAVAMDKIATKRHLQGIQGIRFANDVDVDIHTTCPKVLGFPLIVKPATGGSTVGLSIVKHESDWQAARQAALMESTRALAEEFIEGREVTVAVLDGESLPVVRIVPAGGFYDYEAKYHSHETRYEVPAALSTETAIYAQRIAVAAYHALGCRGLARVDFIVPTDGSDPVLLEINTIPGMTDHSLAPMAAATTGLSFDALVERLIATAGLDG